MNFVQPGGVALAAVELPETNYANTDFSSAFFNVSVHKSLTADQCTEFAVPQPKTVAMTEPAPAIAGVLNRRCETGLHARSEVGFSVRLRADRARFRFGERGEIVVRSVN